MKITAPVDWLDYICRDLLIEEATNDGWLRHVHVPDPHWYRHDDYATFIAIPDPSMIDYKSRILEAIEGIAAVKGITAAEWFQSNLFLHSGGKLNV